MMGTQHVSRDGYTARERMKGGVTCWVHLEQGGQQLGWQAAKIPLVGLQETVGTRRPLNRSLPPLAAPSVIVLPSPCLPVGCCMQSPQQHAPLVRDILN